MASKINKNNSSTLGRSLRLFGMVGQLAAREAVYRIGRTDAARELKTRVDQARVLAEQLSKLKGAAMKAGQLLSLDTSDFLPREALEVLAQLQSKAEAHPTRAMWDILVKELGAEKSALLTNFSEQAEAAASIGQLHSAVLNGQKLAIKIQYPGISESIDSDLAILKKVAQSFLKATGKNIPLDEAFVELGSVLHRETDYELERQSLDKYAQMLNANLDYIVPKTFADFSTKKILTMSWEHGEHVLDWLQSKPSLAERERLARLVLDLFCMEFMEWGLVQTDPNFANFLIRRDPLRLVCLDFGATLTYEPEFRKGYAKLLRTLNSSDYHTLYQGALEFGLLDAREPDDTQIAFQKMIRVAMEPFQRENQPFDFTNPNYEKRTIEANLDFSRKLKFSAPPRRILFLHRKLGGTFNLVKKMGVQIDLTPYWERMTRDI